MCSISLKIQQNIQGLFEIWETLCVGLSHTWGHLTFLSPYQKLPVRQPPPRTIILITENTPELSKYFLGVGSINLGRINLIFCKVKFTFLAFTTKLPTLPLMVKLSPWDSQLQSVTISHSPLPHRVSSDGDQSSFCPLSTQQIFIESTHKRLLLLS